MSRVGPREKRARSQKQKAWVLGIISAILLLSIIFLVARAMLDSTMLDSETLCVEGGPPPAFWAVLVDVTDTLNVVQRASLRQRFEDLKEEIPQGSMLALFKVDDAPHTALEPLVALCSPGTGEDLNVLTSNPELARRKWEERFEEPLNAMLDSVLVGEDLPQSPIMEAVRNVKVASDSLDSPERRLIVFSDMLQHSPMYSHYESGSAPFSSVRQYKLERAKTDLTGWEIVVHYVRRHDGRAQQIQGRGHIEFWDDYFQSMGAPIREVIRIDG